MPNFDTSSPIGSENRGGGAAILRGLKSALVSSLRGGVSEGLEGVFPGANPSTDPVFRYRGRKGDSASIQTPGMGGLYFDTDKGALRRDNGTSWDYVTANIPTGTSMSFYQAAAPTGWTAVSANDKFLRVTTGGTTGGATGGTIAASTSINHTHSGTIHNHTGVSHIHHFAKDGVDTNYGQDLNKTVVAESGDNGKVGTALHSEIPGSPFIPTLFFETTSTVVSTTVNTSYTTGASLGVQFACADIVIAVKD